MANKPFPFSVCKECCVGSGEAIDLTEIENEITKLNSEISAVQNDIGQKQNISNDLTIVSGANGRPAIVLNGKTQHYYCEYVADEDNNTLIMDIYGGETLEKEEFTFYLYLNLSSENLISLDIRISSTGGITWLDTPTIDYPHTKMLLAFQTTDGGASWIANQCYSLEVTE